MTHCCWKSGCSLFSEAVIGFDGFQLWQAEKCQTISVTFPIRQLHPLLLLLIITSLIQTAGLEFRPSEQQQTLFPSDARRHTAQLAFIHFSTVHLLAQYVQTAFVSSKYGWIKAYTVSNLTTGHWLVKGNRHFLKSQATIKNGRKFYQGHHPLSEAGKVKGVIALSHSRSWDRTIRSGKWMEASCTMQWKHDYGQSAKSEELQMTAVCSAIFWQNLLFTATCA